MELANINYFGFYCFVENELNDKHCQNKGDNISVGQEIQIKISTYLNAHNKELPLVTIENLANELVGFLPRKFAESVYNANQAGWTIKTCVSAVAYDEGIEEYIAQVAVLAYKDSQDKRFDKLYKCIFDKIAQGNHVKLDYEQADLEKIFKTDPTKYEYPTVKLPKLPKGKAYYKRRATATENMVIAASQNKIGCWIGSFAVFAVVAAIIIFIILKIFGII